MATVFIEGVKRFNTQLQLTDAVTLLQVAPKLNEQQKILTYSAENPALWDYATVGTALSTAQGGNGASTNYLDTATRDLPAGALFRFVTTIGATPTCTYQIQGSNDHSSWSSIFAADSATPTTFVSSTFAVTTAGTKFMFVKPGQLFRYLQVTYSLNTNVTNTCDVIVF